MPSTTSSLGSDTASSDEPTLSGRLGYSFDDDSLLELALRHRSWCAEHGAVESNERLEFLGDSVLGVVITDHLYGTFPDEAEGVLAQRRAELVNAAALADLARGLGLGEDLLLGKGEESTGGRNKPSLLADGIEAVFGAVYLDGGFASARDLIIGLYRGLMSNVASGALFSDHKSRLQELAAQMFGELPVYELSDTGPEHEKVFTASVTLRGVERGRGRGRTKKEAEQNAALEAFDRLVEAPEGRRSGDPEPSTGDDCA